MDLTPSLRIEDALMIAESVAAYHLEFNIFVWFVSLDLRKAFDHVDANALLQFFVIVDCQMLISLFFSNSTLTNIDLQIEATRSK